MATPRTALTRRPTKARPATVEIKVDRTLKHAWETTLAEMLAARHPESGGFDAYWEAVGAIIDHDPPLYLAGGYATASEFMRQHVGESERTARRMVRVARFASPDDETRYGVSRLDAALGRLEAQGLDLAGGRVPVDFARLRVPVKRGGKSARTPLDEATVDEVRAATGAAQRKAKESPMKAATVARAVTGALTKVAALHGVTVHHAHDAAARGKIATGAWDAFAKAVAKVKMPGE